MIFSVSEDCLRLGLRARVIVFRGVKIGPSDPVLRADIKAEAEAIRTHFGNLTAIRSAPEVIRFQEILRKVGVNPRREQPSVERLLNCALQRGDLPAVNTLVDAYNLVSVRSFYSLGAHDLDRIAVPVTLRLLTGKESFTPLGQDKEVPVIAGEYGYVDARDRLLCRLDIRQAEFSKVTTQTQNVLLIVEGTTDDRPESFRQVGTAGIDQVRRFCGGTAEIVAEP
jgi:DNA/RNA-binding domain of Phe-tRNA-synthetase-like protein